MEEEWRAVVEGGVEGEEWWRGGGGLGRPLKAAGEKLWTRLGGHQTQAGVARLEGTMHFGRDGEAPDKT